MREGGEGGERRKEKGEGGRGMKKQKGSWGWEDRSVEVKEAHEQDRSSGCGFAAFMRTALGTAAWKRHQERPITAEPPGVLHATAEGNEKCATTKAAHLGPELTKPGAPRFGASGVAFDFALAAPGSPPGRGT